jgi:hypothetical protein
MFWLDANARKVVARVSDVGSPYFNPVDLQDVSAINRLLDNWLIGARSGAFRRGGSYAGLIFQSGGNLPASRYARSRS